MSALLARFDRWADAPQFSALDLGRFRVVYVLVALSLMPDFRWISALPFSFFDAPVGPFQLAQAIPDETFFTVLQAALVVSLVLLGFGLFTKTVSVLSAVLFTIGFGYSYSFGKIDHSFLVILVPLMVAWAGWGKAFSLDALRARRRGTADTTVRNYPMRLLAVLIGLAFLTSALPKVLAGWLSLDSQATLGFIARGTATDGGWWLTDLLIGFQPRLLLESLDWLSIIFEAGLIVAALNWRFFRIWCSFLVLFHVGVALTLGIYFIINLCAYAAFVKWSALRLPAPPPALAAWWTRWGLVVAPVVGVVVWLAIFFLGNARWLSGPGIVAVAGVVAVWYLVRQVLLLVRRRRGASSPALV